jgi:predicted nuclease with TOPRIM domain
VALAAIQGLNQKLTEELKRRDAENTELKQRLEKLEQRINQKDEGAK